MPAFARILTSNSICSKCHEHVVRELADRCPCMHLFHRKCNLDRINQGEPCPCCVDAVESITGRGIAAHPTRDSRESGAFADTAIVVDSDSADDEPPQGGAAATNYSSGGASAPGTPVRGGVSPSPSPPTGGDDGRGASAPGTPMQGGVSPSPSPPTGGDDGRGASAPDAMVQEILDALWSPLTEGGDDSSDAGRSLPDGSSESDMDSDSYTDSDEDGSRTPMSDDAPSDEEYRPRTPDYPHVLAPAIPGRDGLGAAAPDAPQSAEFMNCPLGKRLANTNCPICFESLRGEPYQVVSILSCMHLLHETCLMKLRAYTNECPVCRRHM